MIIGIGSDLIDIRRVAKVIERHGERFLDRIFTEAERAKADRREPLGVGRSQGSLFQGARHRDPARGLVARHGGYQPAGGTADHGTDRRGAGSASVHDAGRP